MKRPEHPLRHLLPLALLLGGAALGPVERAVPDLVFAELDGSARDADGRADGVWTVAASPAPFGRLSCGEGTACEVALAVAGDLALSAGSGVEAARGLRLEVAGDLTVAAGAYLAALDGDVRISVAGRVRIDGLVSASGGAGAGAGTISIAAGETAGAGIFLGPAATVVSEGGAAGGNAVELSGCGLEVEGLVAAVAGGPGARVVVDSCADVRVGAPAVPSAAAAPRRGRIEVSAAAGSALVEIVAAGSVALDGAALRADGGPGGLIAVSARGGEISWRHGAGRVGAPGRRAAGGRIRLAACRGVDLLGSRLEPPAELAVSAECGEAGDASGSAGPPWMAVVLPEATSPRVGTSSSPACTPNLMLANQTITVIKEFIACNSITAETFRIIPRGFVTFRAGQLIVLNEGFSVEGSAFFQAILDPTLNQPPEITSDGGGPTAMKSVPENTTFVTDVDATDPEGDTEGGGGLTYSLSGADAAKFTIDAVGMLAFQSAPDFDVPGDADANNLYQVTVTVTDSSGGTDSQDLTVEVTDVNEPPAITSSAMQTAAENQTSVATLTATDPDVPAQTLTWMETGGADAGKLSITAGGVLTFDAAPDFENPDDFDKDGVYVIDVKVDDGAGLMDTQTVMVTVTDVNDDPVITSPAMQTAAENQTAVATLTATDQDLPTQTLTWTKTGTGADDAFFSITAGGVLTFDMAPDFENKADANGDGVYEVEVKVDDGAGGMAIQTVLVTVTDVNEPPTITSSAMQTAAENQTSVATLTATDPDLPAQTLTWMETGGADAGKLSISAGGVLTFDMAPDFEAPDDADSDGVYVIDVKVDDGAGGMDTQTVMVTVTDVNEPPAGVADTFDHVGNTLLLVDKATSGGAEVLVSTTAGMTPAADGVLDNDSDPEGAISVSGIVGCGDMTAPYDCMTVNMGGVVMESNGQFSFTPKPGDAAMSDSFQYNLFDGTSTVAVTVTLNRKNRVWYVDNDHTPNGDPADDGTSADPFTTLAGMDSAESESGTGDTIYVFSGNSTTSGQNAGITLKDQQRLLGEGVDLTVPEGLNGAMGPTTLFDSASNPKAKIENTGGDGVTVDASAGDRTGIEIRGLDVAGSGNAIDVTAAVANKVEVTIGDNNIADSGSEGIDLNPASSGLFEATIEDNTFSTSSPTGNAIDVVQAATAGQVEVAINDNLDVTSSSGIGIHVDGGAAGSGTLFVTGLSGNTVHGNTGGTGIRIVGATFDADPSDGDFDPVAGGTTAVGSVSPMFNPVGAGGVVLGDAGAAATRVSGSLSFTQLDVVAGAGSGLAVAGSGVFVSGPPDTGFQLAVTAGTALATGGPALDVDPATVNATFNRIDSTNSPGAGVRLKDVDGSVTIQNGPPDSLISGPMGTAFEVDGGKAMVFFDGLINQPSATSGFAVEVKNRPTGAGDVTFSNAIGNAGPIGGQGISVASNAAGAITFSGPVRLSTGANNAVGLTGNGGVTMRFSGGLDIDTTTGIGFQATGGGTVDVCADTGCGAGPAVTNTVDVGAGAAHAVDLNGVTLGFADVNFDSITAAGGCGMECIDADIVSNAGIFNGGTVVIAGTGGGAAGIDVSGSSAAFDFTSATIDATAGAGIRLVGANGSVTFDTVDVDGTGGHGVEISGNTSPVLIDAGSIGATTTSGGDGVNINGGTGNVTIDATIGQSTANNSVDVRNRAGGTVTFNGAIDDNAAGIFLDNNDGGGTNRRIDFTGVLDLDTTTNPAFTATNGGTVNVTATTNDIDTTTGTAINIADTLIGTLGVTFQSVSANGAANGILLDDTGSNAFSVTGTGTTDGSGGTVQNVTARGFSGTTVQNVTLKNMNFTNVAINNGADPTNSASTCGSINVDGLGTNTGCNAAIHLVNASTVTIDNVSINGSNQQGINGNNVTGLTLTNVDLTDIGDQVRETGIRIRDPKGNFDFNNVDVNMTGEGGIEIHSGSATALTLDVRNGSSVTNANGNGLQFEAAAAGGSWSVNIDDSTFTGNATDGIHVFAGLTSPSTGGTLTLDIDDNIVQSNNIGINAATFGTATGNFTIRNNGEGATSSGFPVRVNNNASHLINVTGDDASTVNANVLDNTLDGLGNTAGNLIRVRHDGSTAAGGTIVGRVLIDDNTLNGANQDGIFVNIRDGLGAGTQQLHATITNNVLNHTGSATGSGPDGIETNAQDNHTMCVAIGDLAAADPPNDDNVFAAGTQFPGSEIEVRGTGNSTVNVFQGGSGSVVVTTVLSDNNTLAGGAATTSGSGTGGKNVVMTACSLPPAPPM